MVSGTAGSMPCPASKAGHERDDGGYCERLRRGLPRYGMIYARQEGRLVLTLALPYPWWLVTVYSADDVSSLGGVVRHGDNKGLILVPRPTTRATLIFRYIEQ